MYCQRVSNLITGLFGMFNMVIIFIVSYCCSSEKNYYLLPSVYSSQPKDVNCMGVNKTF